MRGFTRQMGFTEYRRRAVLTLLRFAKTTSDPEMAAALVAKAAEMTDRPTVEPLQITDDLIDDLDKKARHC